MPKMLTQNWGEGMHDIKNGNGKAKNDGGYKGWWWGEKSLMSLIFKN
jgi:hypothetical protein